MSRLELIRATGTRVKVLSKLAVECVGYFQDMLLVAIKKYIYPINFIF